MPGHIGTSIVLNTNKTAAEIRREFPAAEVRLIDASLDTVAVGRPGQPGQLRKRPDRLIADRAYDGNVARVLLVRRGIEPIIPAQSNNRQATHQDGRRVRRYRQRWIVERTIGWLGNFRRLTVRYDRLLEAYSGFFHLAYALGTPRKVLK
jgi:transposase